MKILVLWAMLIAPTATCLNNWQAEMMGQSIMFKPKPQTQRMTLVQFEGEAQPTIDLDDDCYEVYGSSVRLRGVKLWPESVPVAAVKKSTEVKK